MFRSPRQGEGELRRVRKERDDRKVTHDAIRRHHSAPFTNPTVVLDAVALANVVAKTIETGLGAEGLNFSMDPGSDRRLGVDFATFGRVCLQADAGLREMTRVHGAAR
ncbi:MAG: hypothetical protein ABJA98_09075 [Acidobacteriota bacterium]